MKQVIELLEKATANMREAIAIDPQNDYLYETDLLIDQAIKALQAPRWETPEQYEKRTGKELPDEFPVWERHVFRYDREPWSLTTYDEAKGSVDDHKGSQVRVDIVIAGEAGAPPLEWEPEEEN